MAELASIDLGGEYPTILIRAYGHGMRILVTPKDSLFLDHLETLVEAMRHVQSAANVLKEQAHGSESDASKGR